MMIWSSMVTMDGAIDRDEGDRSGGEKPRAGQLMKPVPGTLSQKDSVAEAMDRMRRWDTDCLPVADGGRAVGMVSRWDLSKALDHRLGGESVRIIMTVPLHSVPPDASWRRMCRKMADKRIACLAVMRSQSVLGLVSQADLSGRSSADTTSVMKVVPRPEGRINLRETMENRYSPEILAALRRAGRLGRRRGEEVYLVGGSVRDLLLEVADKDMDLAVVGDGMAFADAYVGRYGGRLVCYRRFATALMVLPGGIKLDVVSARHEKYEHPGALPTIKPGPLWHDLYRRDFTINSMAIQLSGRHFGRLLDPFGGRRDLDRGAIEVMHNLSFVDDPTRMIRAVRFEGRYGFRISPRTRHLFQGAAAAHMLDRISGQRLREELLILLREPKPLPAIRRLDHLGVWESLHGDLKLSQDRIDLLARIGRHLSRWRDRWPDERVSGWMAYLVGLFSSLSFPQAERLADRIALQRRARETLGMAQRYGDEVIKSLSAPHRPPNSVLYQILHRFPAEVLIYFMALGRRRAITGRIIYYRSRLHDVRLDIDGQDLKEMGLDPGIAFGQILDSVLMAKLDGRANDRREQLALARRLAATDSPRAGS
jgi:tRNA nucleotidyltransferase (CCA-adding enzyme)